MISWRACSKESMEWNIVTQGSRRWFGNGRARDLRLSERRKEQRRTLQECGSAEKRDFLGKHRPRNDACTLSQERLEPAGEEGAGLDDGGVALGASRDHAYFDLEKLRDEAEVVDGCFREL